MPYEVLALKYRPKVFEDLVGQETVARTLMNAIQQDRIANAFLFSGVRGVGKTTTARILARALNCQRGPTVRPCGECAACDEIARGVALDVLEIDGASNNGVDQVREIVDGSRYAPSRDRFKIYIIDEVHMLSTAAFNALLKTLEEPPPAVKFIFATTEHHKIPDTILSRCQEFEFRTVPPGQIAAHLSDLAKSEGIEVSEPAVRMVARAAAGSLRDGISALDQVIAATEGAVEEKDVTELLGLIERDVLRETTEALVAQDTARILEIVDGLSRSGRDFRFFTASLMQYLRDVLVAKVAPGVSDLIEIPGEADSLRALGEHLSEEDLMRALDVLTQVEGALRNSPEPRFHLEMALLKLSQMRRLASFEELLERFEALASGGSPPPGSGGPAPPPRSSSTPRSRPSSPSRPSGPSRRASEAPAPEPAPREAEPAAPPQASSPPEASPPPPADDGSFPGRLVTHLKGSKPMLHALVSHCEDSTLEGNTLELRYSAEHRAIVNQLNDKALSELLREQASKLAGRKLGVRVFLRNGEAAAKEPEPAPPAEAAPANDESPVREAAASAPSEEEEASLRDRADRDPLVRRFIDTFKGEIESVRKSSS